MHKLKLFQMMCIFLGALYNFRVSQLITGPSHGTVKSVTERTLDNDSNVLVMTFCEQRVQVSLQFETGKQWLLGRGRASSRDDSPLLYCCVPFVVGATSRLAALWKALCGLSVAKNSLIIECLLRLSLINQSIVCSPSFSMRTLFYLYWRVEVRSAMSK